MKPQSKKQEDFFSDIIMTDSMKLGASKPAKNKTNSRSVNRITTNASRNNKTEEKVVKKTEPKITEHKNGVSKKEKGDFFSDFDDKREEKIKEETEPKITEHKNG